MAGKGHKRRPRFVSREEYDRRHDKIIWNKDKKDGPDNKQSDKSD